MKTCFNGLLFLRKAFQLRVQFKKHISIFIANVFRTTPDRGIMGWDYFQKQLLLCFKRNRHRNKTMTHFPTASWQQFPPLWGWISLQNIKSTKNVICNYKIPLRVLKFSFGSCLVSSVFVVALHTKSECFVHWLSFLSTWHPWFPRANR